MVSRWRDRMWPGWRLVASIALFVVFAALVLDWVNGDSDADPLRAAAVGACRDEFIPAELQVPDSAHYDLSASGGPTTYAVTGTVDAETSAGPTSREEVRCVVTLVGGEKWRLESLEL